MRITVVGAGALGRLLAGLLARAGHPVSFVARGDALRAIAAKGFTVMTPAGPFETGPLRASDKPSELGASELVLVAVKSWQVEGVAPTLAPLVGEGTMVLPVQNGVEAADHLAAALGEACVLGGVCHVLATREAGDRVRYIGPAPLVTIGERPRGKSARVDRLVDVLAEAGITARASEEIGVALWVKLLFVEPLGSVGAATRSPVDVVRAVPETRAMLERAMREVEAVAAGRGVRVPADAVEKAMVRVDALPEGATASMQRDIVEGRPSELGEQTGAVVRLGRSVAVGTPVHDALYASLLPQERRSRGAAAP
jgi:2-dehydropantoate 2-reductase